MTETTEAVSDSTHAPAAPQPVAGPAGRPNRLYQAAAGVAIVAGVVFIVGAIFFTGVALGRHSGHGGGWDGPRHQCGVMMPRPPGPPMGGGPDDRKPAMMGPGMMEGPGMRGPSDAPTPPQPAPPGR